MPLKVKVGLKVSISSEEVLTPCLKIQLNKLSLNNQPDFHSNHMLKSSSSVGPSGYGGNSSMVLLGAWWKAQMVKILSLEGQKQLQQTSAM